MGKGEADLGINSIGGKARRKQKKKTKSQMPISRDEFVAVSPSGPNGKSWSGADDFFSASEAGTTTMAEDAVGLPSQRGPGIVALAAEVSGYQHIPYTSEMQGGCETASGAAWTGETLQHVKSNSVKLSKRGRKLRCSEDKKNRIEAIRTTDEHKAWLKIKFKELEQVEAESFWDFDKKFTEQEASRCADMEEERCQHEGGLSREKRVVLDDFQDSEVLVWSID
jgi:hypothetical protein